MTKFTAPSTFRNREHILSVFKEYNLSEGRLLEIGSLTGEHGIYFAQQFPKLHWVTSDMKVNHKGLKENLKDANLKNLHGPEVLKVGDDDFPKGKFDYVFTANTLHIMSWKECKSLFKLLGKRLREGSVVFMYGPFNYNGNFSSESNADFDGLLKSNNPKSGIRNFEDVLSNMSKAGFKLLKDHEMPANNRVLCFERLAFIS